MASSSTPGPAYVMRLVALVCLVGYLREIFFEQKFLTLGSNSKPLPKQNPDFVPNTFHCISVSSPILSLLISKHSGCFPLLNEFSLA